MLKLYFFQLFQCCWLFQLECLQCLPTLLLLQCPLPHPHHFSPITQSSPTCHFLLSCPQRYTKDPAATQDLPVPCRLRGTNHLLSETFLSSLPTGPRSLLTGSFQDEKKKEGGNYLILLQRKPLPNHSAKEEFTSTQTQISISLFSQTFSTPYTQF